MEPFAMAYGAVLSAVLATILVAYAVKDRRRAVLVTASASALIAPICWNSILRLTGATSAFSHDLPFRPFPISWQDVGSGVFTLAVACVAFAAGTTRADPAARAAQLALWTASGALLVDIYLY